MDNELSASPKMDDRLTLVAALDLAIASGRDFHGLPLAQLRAALRQDSSGGVGTAQELMRCLEQLSDGGPFDLTDSPKSFMAQVQELVRDTRSVISHAVPHESRSAEPGASQTEYQWKPQHESSAATSEPSADYARGLDGRTTPMICYDQGYRAGLEDAAKVCDHEAEGWRKEGRAQYGNVIAAAAVAIRAKIKPRETEGK
jgi:hypothetical protein